MGFLNRFTHSLGNLVKADLAPPAFMWDLATIPFSDNDGKNFSQRLGVMQSQVADAAKKRTMQFAEGTIGPESTAGVLIDQLPKPIKNAGNGVLDGLEWAYRNGVSRPLSTTYGAVNLAQSRNDAEDSGGITRWFGAGARVAQVLSNKDERNTLLSGKTWSDAWDQSRDKSWGQSFANLMIGVDPEDQKEVEKYAGSWAWEGISSTTDLFGRLFLDPALVGGKAVKVARGYNILKDATTGARTITPRIVNTEEDINRAVSSTKHQEYLEDVQGKSVGEIEQKYFAGHDDGALIAGLAKEASGDEDEFRLLTRTLMGDRNALSQLQLERSALAPQIGKLFQEDVAIRNLADATPTQLSLLDENAPTRFPLSETKGDQRQWGFSADEAPLAGMEDVLHPLPPDKWLDAHFAIHNNEARRAEVLEEINKRIPEYNLIQKKIDLNLGGAMRELPNASGFDNAINQFRVTATRSELYQKSLLGNAIRTVFTNVPHRIINTHDNASYVQVQRMLQQSGMAADDVDRIVQNYVRAGVDDRPAQLVAAEEASMRHITQGIDEEDFQKILAAKRRGQAQASEVLAKRMYDGEGRSRVRYMDNEAEVSVDLPLMVAQNANILPVADVAQLKRAADRAREVTNRNEKYKQLIATFTDSKAYEIPDELMNAFYKVWKPATLFRLGYPIRVQTDNQMRILATIGARAHLQQLGRNGRDGMNAIRTQIRNSGSLTGPLSGTVRNLDPFTPGQRNLLVGGHVFPGVFGAPGDSADITKELISSSTSYKAMAGTLEADLLRSMREPNELDDIVLPSGRKVSGSWVSLNPADPATELGDYKVAWNWVVNKQLGQDKLARQLLMGKSDDEVINYLTKTPEGLDQLLRINSRRRDDIQKWVDDLRGQVDSYTMGVPAIKAAALDGKADTSMMKELFEDKDVWPTIHGPELKQAMRKGAIVETYDKIIDAGYKVLASAPDDILARQPFAATMYENEVKRLVAIKGGDARAMNIDEIDGITRGARNYAVNQTKKVLFDMKEQSQFAGMLRFLSPFFTAQQETLVRWTGIVARDPSVAVHLRNVWQAPEKLGLVHDENDLEITFDGRAVDPKTGKQVIDPVTGKAFEPGKERYVLIPIPKAIADADLPLISKYVKAGGGPLSINKKGLNTLATLSIGWGPPVQIAASEVAKHNPGTEQALKDLMIIPYGAQANENMVSPSIVRKLTEKEDDITFTNRANEAYRTMITRYMQAKDGPNPLPEPKFEDAIEQARRIRSLGLVSQMTLPAAVGFSSPYQMYIGAYRRVNNSYGEVLAKDPTAAPLGRNDDGSKKTPEDWFTDNYGTEYMQFTQALSKSNDGVPATVEALKSRKEHQEWIEKYSDLGLGGLIIGSEGAGAYSNAARQIQLSSKVKPGSGSNQREGKSLEEFAQNVQTAPAWEQYGKAMDLIDAERSARGLNSLNVKGAEDLSMAKKALTQKLAEQYPAWYEQLMSPDLNKNSQKIEAMENLVTDPKLIQRDEFKYLKVYLDARKLFTNELAARKAAGGAATIESNPDLLEAWDRVTNTLIDSSLPFSDTYYRYLSNDKLVAR